MRRLLAILCLVSLVTSCASSRRFARVWKERTSKTEKEPDRTNMFPFFYLSGTSSTVLWPLIDSDQNGFSVRPVFNKEGNEYAALFPLSAWNPVKGDGWVGPYYWNQNQSALIPLYFNSENFLQLLNYYETPKSSGLFPVYHLSDNSFNVIGLYGRKKLDDYEKHTVLLGLLSHWEFRGEEKFSGHFLNYYTAKDESYSQSILFPFYFGTETKEGDNKQLIFPFYYYHTNPNGDKGFYTLLGGSSKVGDELTSSIALLWWSGESQNSNYKTLFPIFSKGQNEHRKYFYLFPWRSSEGKNYEASSLFPFYNSSSRFDDDNNLVSGSWSVPLFLPIVSNHKSQNHSNTSSLYGLIFDHSKTNGRSEGSVLSILADWSKDEDSSRFRFPAFFNLTGIVDITENKDSSKINLLLYSHEKSPEITRRDIFPFITWDSGQNEKGFSFLWRVFEHHEKNGQKGGHIFFIPWGV